MAKVCTCGCNGPVFSRGLCQRAWKREYGKPIQQKPKDYRQAVIPSKPIPKKSKKRTAREKEYAKLKRDCMPYHLVCEAGDKIPEVRCTFSSTEVHHMQGREGDLLCDIDKWLFVCHTCHDWITEHSAEAIDRGLSLRRNTALDNPGTGK